MSRLSFLAPFAACLLAVGTAQASTFYTSDFDGDLQAAVDAAAAGDEIVVDVPSSGAALTKQLQLTGTPEGSTGALVLAPAPGVPGDASGTSLNELQVSTNERFAVSGFNSPGLPAARDVTIANCTIIGRDRGVRMRGAANWNIHHNYLQGGFNAVQVAAGSTGIHVHHNELSVALWGVLINANVPTSISDVRVRQNRIRSAVGGGLLVRAGTPGTALSGVEISGNDLTEAFGRSIVVEATEILEDSRTEPDSYVSDLRENRGTVDGLLVRGNEYRD